MPRQLPSTRRTGNTALLPLLLLAIATLHANPASAHNIERSIDLAGSNLDNGLEIVETQSLQQQHPHSMPDKPSKLDLDVSQYTETDDKSLLEIERAGGSDGSTAQSAVVASSTEASDRADERVVQNSEMTRPTVATSPEEETSNRGSSKLTKCDEETITVKCIEKRIKAFLRTISSVSVFNVSESVQIARKSDGARSELDRSYLANVKTNDSVNNSSRKINNNNNNSDSTSLVDQIHRFAREHVVNVKLPSVALAPRDARTFFGALAQGKSTFLTGFGLGFLAFGLKKLLLPLFIGVQIVKSILIALFLPSIIGSLGKIVGKGEYGVSSFAQSSQNPQQQLEENYEFKDNTADLYNDDYMTRQPLGTLPASAMYDETMLQPQQTSASGASNNAKAPEIMSRYSFVDPRLTPMNALTDRYYTRHMVNPAYAKKQDFKVFHEIPTSSLLLTNYDPFYSPLLSRLDAVFARLGHHTEGCREYAVCAMYRSPARYAPYSNLVSAQLSRELNELRKPSSDNPDVLRFFRYMKAAKDGQDGVRCEDAYIDCPSARDDQTIRQNQAMLATYQDIDKLVHARKL